MQGKNLKMRGTNETQKLYVVSKFKTRCTLYFQGDMKKLWLCVHLSYHERDTPHEHIPVVTCRLDDCCHVDSLTSSCCVSDFVCRSQGSWWWAGMPCTKWQNGFLQKEMTLEKMMPEDAENTIYALSEYAHCIIGEYSC